MLDINIIKKQWVALGQDNYDVGMINQKTGKKMSDIRSRPQMLQKLARYQEFSDRGENLYIRGVPDVAHDLIFLDDMTPEGIVYLKSKQLFPAAVDESSLDNLQCWLRLGLPACKATRKACERGLIASMNAAGIPGSKARNQSAADHGAADGQHYGRLAGSRHQKSGFTVRLVEASGHVLAPQITEALIRDSRLFADETPPDGGEILELRELLDGQYDRPEITRDAEHFAQLATDPDRSKADFYLACRLAKNGYGVRDVAKALAEYGPNDYDRKKAPARYLQDTARKAVARERP